jgi:glycosyltransferase involved in cell wall biosynthesis
MVQLTQNFQDGAPQIIDVPALPAISGKARARKPFILSLVHLPPPTTGVSMVSSLVMNSERLNSMFELKGLPLRSSESIEEIGSLGIKKIIRILKIGKDLLRFCIFTKPDLVYFTLTPNGAAFYRDIFYVGILKLTSVKRLYHIHAKEVPESMLTPLGRSLQRWAFRGAKVIFLSPSIYKGFSKIVLRSNCYFLPNGIPDEAGPYPNGAGGKRDEDPPHILFFSNIGVTKGPMILLRALGMLRKKGLQFRASFAGHWESRKVEDQFYRLVEENSLADVVEYRGPKFGDEKKSIFRSANIVAFPTYNDTFPVVILEAMSFSLPVVSTFEGAIPDIVVNNETGFLIPVKDAYVLAEHIELLMKKPSLARQFGKAGRTRFLEHFTYARFEDRLKDIFWRCTTFE